MKTLMVQGTTSDAGKSTLVAALCRIFANLNFRVAPFKPQNMALNSAVTEDGGEIGRAQALQAVAARVPAQIDFNPILLKPNSDTGAQVILHGKAISNMEADAYHDYKKVAMDAVLSSYQRLSQNFDILMVEGAGSPAEINLRENDIANMGFAEAVDCPVIIIADIDKGGVFAHLIGTLACLSESEQNRVKGFVINRFRGDINLLTSGLDWLEEKTSKPVLGVLPYLHDLALDAEDAITVKNVLTPKESTIKISVLLLPHISNHTDFDTLRLNPQIDLAYVKVAENIPTSDLIIIPGSKNVIGDLQFLMVQGWQQQINQHLRYGGKVLGICGGYQMLGREIIDPLGIESNQQKINGLNLLPMRTELTDQKALIQVSGQMQIADDVCDVTGYEIHCGISSSDKQAKQKYLITYLNEQQEPVLDGYVSYDNKVVGTYLHGLFDNPQATELLCRWVKPEIKLNHHISLAEHREKELERLAKVCSEYLDIDKIQSILGAEKDDK